MLLRQIFSGSGKNYIHEKIFRENYEIALLQELLIMGESLIDGIMCGIFMGSRGIAVQGLCGPFFSTMGIIAAMLILGTQKLCVNAYCKGERKKADEAFSTAVIIALIASVLLMILCGVYSGTAVRLLGATEDLTDGCKAYLTGLCIGAPFTILVPVLIPVVQLNGQKKYIEISMTVPIIADVLLNVLAGVSGSMFGMGLASSVAMAMSLAVLVVALLKKRTVRLRLRSFRFDTLRTIGYYGLPKAVKRVCNVIRPVTVNRVIIAIAGTAGMSAMSIRNGLSGLFECFGAALGSVVTIFAILYSGEGNGPGLERTKTRTVRFLLFPIAAISVLILIFARYMVRIYVHDDAEVIGLATVAVRFMALDILLYALFESVSSYWQGIGEVKPVNVIVVFVKLGFPLISVFLLGTLYGTTGVWMSFPVSLLLSILTFFVPAAFKYRKFTLFPIPSECAVSPEHRYECVLDDLSQVSKHSEEIRKLCIQSGMEKSRAYHMALCFEEITVGILESGHTKDRRGIRIDAFLCIQDGQIKLRVLDNCQEFDAVSFYNTLTFDPDHPENHLGIRIVMSAAEDIHYAGMFGLNSLTVSV